MALMESLTEWWRWFWVRAQLRWAPQESIASEEDPPPHREVKGDASEERASSHVIMQRTRPLQVNLHAFV
jgi:hypothetical protein